MRVRLLKDDNASNFGGIIASDISDGHELRIYLPDRPSALPHVGIYDKDNNFLKGVVIPEGYNTIKISQDEPKEKVKLKCYSPFKLEVGRQWLTSYIGTVDGLSIDPVSGDYSVVGSCSKINRAFTVYVSNSAPQFIPNDLGFKYLGRIDQASVTKPYYVYMHKDFTEGLDDD